VVTLAVGLARRALLDLVDGAVVRGAVGETESALISSLGRWGAWVTAIGVVLVALSVFLGSPLTLRQHAARVWEGSTTRPAGAGATVARVLVLLIIVLLAIFALDALLTLVVAVAIALLVAYGIAQLLRLAGVGAREPQPD
jgi:Na+/alanine symporter